MGSRPWGASGVGALGLRKVGSWHFSVTDLQWRKLPGAREGNAMPSGLCCPCKMPWAPSSEAGAMPGLLQLKVPQGRLQPGELRSTAASSSLSLSDVSPSVQAMPFAYCGCLALVPLAPARALLWKCLVLTVPYGTHSLCVRCPWPCPCSRSCPCPPSPPAPTRSPGCNSDELFLQCSAFVIRTPGNQASYQPAGD